MTVKEKFGKLWRFFKKSCWYIYNGDPGQIFRDIASWWHFKHIAYRDVLEYDEQRNRYVIHRTTRRMKDILPDDLPITGQKYHFFRTELQAPPRQETRVETIVLDDGSTVDVEYLNTSATSNYLYMINNDINDALAGQFKPAGINPLILWGMVGLAVLFGVWYLFLR